MREFHPEIVVDVKSPCDANQDLCKLGVDTPVALHVGVGEGVPGNSASDAHVIELGALRPQACLDVAQALAISQLGEGHAKELIQAGKGFDLVIAVIFLDAATEIGQWQMIHELSKNRSTGIHGSNTGA